MQSLTEAVQRRLGVHTRPQDVDDLLAVRRVPGLDGQDLDQRLGAAPLPAGYGHADIGVLDAESAEEPYPQEGPQAGRRHSCHLGCHLPPPWRVRASICPSRARIPRHRAGGEFDVRVL